MSKFITVIKVILAAVSVLIMGLMISEISEFSRYVPVGLIVAAFIIEAIAILTSFVRFNHGLILDIISAFTSVLAGVLGFISFSDYKGWEDLKLFSIVCLIVAVGPILSGTVTCLKNRKMN